MQTDAIIKQAKLNRFKIEKHKAKLRQSLVTGVFSNSLVEVVNTMKKSKKEPEKVVEVKEEKIIE